MYLAFFSNVKNVLTRTSLVQQSNNFNLAILDILVTYIDRAPSKEKYFPVRISNYRPNSGKYCQHLKTVHKKEKEKDFPVQISKFVHLQRESVCKKSTTSQTNHKPNKLKCHWKTKFQSPSTGKNSTKIHVSSCVLNLMKS